MINNVLNPKQLEKQIKVIESRMLELQRELDELNRMRDACHTLLGTTPQQTAGESEQSKRGRTKREEESAGDLTSHISTVLKSRGGAMTADEIFDELKSSGAPLKGKRPVSAVYETLEKNPEVFSQGENGQWMIAEGGGAEGPGAEAT